MMDHNTNCNPDGYNDVSDQLSTISDNGDNCSIRMTNSRHVQHASTTDSSTTIDKSYPSSSICCAAMHVWWHSKFAKLEEVIHNNHWKVLSGIFILGLLCLGLKFVTVDTDFEKLWIEESDRLISEWRYLANVLLRNPMSSTDQQPHYYHGPDPHRARLLSGLSPETTRTSGGGGSNGASTKSGVSFSGGLPGHEFMGTMETVLQTALETTAKTAEHEESGVNLLTPGALLDHMNFLVKVKRLQITVGSSQWSFNDLCQRATLPFGSNMHGLQAYLNMFIPCIIISPLDCFWEGAKVLGSEEAIYVPWFDKPTRFQWTDLNPIGLLKDLRARYVDGSHAAEIDSLVHLFEKAGINNGYLDRPCLNPNATGCPPTAPNYRHEPPNVARLVSGGCPGFAANMLHWPEEIIAGGRVHQPTPTTSNSTAHSQTTGELVKSSALQSLILLRSPHDLYEAVRLSDPYKHEGWSPADAQHVLDEWRRNLRRLVMEHNVGLQPANSTHGWQYYVFTDNSLRDLLREMTLRLGPVKMTGCVVLVFLYGLVSLLDWRDPVRSQCWLSLAGLFLLALSSVAGLGICAAVGLPFNVLTIQVLPFLLMGLSVDGILTLTTCYHCCLARRTVAPNRKKSHSLVPWNSRSSVATCSSTNSHVCTSTIGAASSTAFPTTESGTSESGSNYSSNYPHRHRSYYHIPVLAEHGPSLLFGTIASAASFFAAAYIPIPLMRQFCLQAGTLVLVQSTSLMVLFPGLLKLDGIRRSQRRLDVLCCLQQPVGIMETTTTLASNPHPDGRHQRHVYSERYTVPTSSSHRGSTVCQQPCGASVQVNVVNHITTAVGTDNTHESATIRVASPEPTRPIPTSATPMTRTLQTTVTVTEQGQDSYVTSCELVQPPSGQQAAAYSTQVRPGRLERMDCQQSGGYRSPHQSPYAQLQVMRSQAQKQTSGGSNNLPLLVRFGRRLALLLTSHWIVQLFVCLLGASLFLIAGLLTYHKLQLGLDWASLTPTDAIEHGFVKHSEQSFGLHNFQLIARGTHLSGTRLPPPMVGSNGRRRAMGPYGPQSVQEAASSRTAINSATVGRGIDFPMQQRQLHQLYHRLIQLPGVVLAGRKFWLEAMRDWLQGVQDAFDRDRQRGLISHHGYRDANASKTGVLGLRLILQVGLGPEPVRINTSRLVKDGIVNELSFYALLRVWRTYDALNFSSLACVIHPEPSFIHLTPFKRQAGGGPSDWDVLPPAAPIEFVQTNFYALGVHGMQDQLELVRNVRHLADVSTAQGIPVFPTGAPFTFSEHYLYLVRETAIALGIFFTVLFIAALVLFSSPITTVLLLIVGAGGGVCAAVCGLVILQLELNPISATLLLFSAGLGARISVGFLGSWPMPHATTTTAAQSSQTLPHTTTRMPRRISLAVSSNRQMTHGGRRWNKSTPLDNTSTEAVDRGAVIHTGSGDEKKQRTCLRSRRLHGSKLVTGTRDWAKVRLVRTLSNQFAPILHTVIALVLALALLAATRVQFIANYFFWLILVVSIICLFNAVCLIPTLCYLSYPIQKYFIPTLSGKHATRLATIAEPLLESDYQTSQPRDNIAPSQQQQPVPHPRSRNQSPSSFSHTFSAPSQSPLVDVAMSSTCFTTQSIPSSSTFNVSTSLAAATTTTTANPVSVNISTSPRPTPVHNQYNQQKQHWHPTTTLATRKTTPPSQTYSNSSLYELCNRCLYDLPNQDAPEAAAAAAAAAAVVVAMATAAAAAAANSAPSRPSSLSTISEEASHTGSVASLNPSAQMGSTPPDQTSHGEGLPQTLPRTSSHAGDFRSLTRFLTMDPSTTADLYRQLCGSLQRQQQVQQHISFPEENGRANRHRRLLYQNDDPLVPHHHGDPSPPPSYSSVFDHDQNRSRQSQNSLPYSHTSPLASNLIHPQHVDNRPSIVNASSNAIIFPAPSLPARTAVQWTPHRRGSQRRERIPSTTAAADDQHVVHSRRGYSITPPHTEPA